MTEPTVCVVSVYGSGGRSGTWAVLDPPVPNKNRYNSVNIRYWWAQKDPHEGGSTWVFLVQ